MKDLLIIGAGGFGRDVTWLVERINEKKAEWNLLGFIDDNGEIKGKTLVGYEVIGGINDIADYPEAYVVCAIANSAVRKRIVERIRKEFSSQKFATLIDPAADISRFAVIGQGSIVCAHTMISLNVKIGENVIINPRCTIGHDSVINDYVTYYPNATTSGFNVIGSCTELGTGMQSIQGLKIGSGTFVGAGAVVIRDIPDKCTAVGNPARPIKFFEKSI